MFDFNCLQKLYIVVEMTKINYKEANILFNWSHHGDAVASTRSCSKQYIVRFKIGPDNLKDEK